MSSATARTAAIIVALYAAYELLFGALHGLTQLPVMLAQTADGRQGVPTVQVLWGLFAPLLLMIPFAIAAFLLFWLAPPRNAARPWVGLAARAALASAAGAIASLVLAAVAAIRVSGSFFTSIPRTYTFTGSFMPAAPATLLNGFADNLPVLVLAAVIGWALVNVRGGRREIR